MKVYYDKDADLSLVKGKNVTIIGYGSQGHAHAQNLNDSGVKVIVGLRKGGASWPKVEKAGLKVAEVADAVKAADVVMILLPDEQIATVYKNDVEPNIKQGASLAFAHGFNVHYGQVVPRADLGHAQAGLLHLGPRGAAAAQAHHDLDTAVVQVLRVRVTLRAVADDRDGLALDEAQVRILVVVHLHVLTSVKSGM